MANQILLNYSANEANILQEIDDAKIAPSKTEALRRGLQALRPLVETDERSLFELLSYSLLISRSNASSQSKLVRSLSQARALACAIHASSIAKKGSAASEFMEIFTATLREYSLLSDKTVYSSIDQSKLMEELAGLDRIASKYAAIESNHAVWPIESPKEDSAISDWQTGQDAMEPQLDDSTNNMSMTEVAYQ
jgi:hypothetical protein